MTPEELIKNGPATVADLVGPALLIARVQSAKAAASTGSPAKLLLYGDPGCGKSAICKLVAQSLTPIMTTGRTSGQDLSADSIREWIDGTRYHQGAAWTVRIVEEADTMSPAAQVLLLQYLDSMPNHHAILCTSNLAMGDLSDRFQSRFQAVEVRRPTASAVSALIKSRWPSLSESADEIAEHNAGDVRASLNDAQTHLDVLEYSE